MRLSALRGLGCSLSCSDDPNLTGSAYFSIATNHSHNFSLLSELAKWLNRNIWFHLVSLLLKVALRLALFFSFFPGPAIHVSPQRILLNALDCRLIYNYKQSTSEFVENLERIPQCSQTFFYSKRSYLLRNISCAPNRLSFSSSITSEIPGSLYYP